MTTTGTPHPSAAPAVPSKRRMRAAVLHGPEDVRLEDVPIPRPGPGELLVRVDVA